MAPSHTTPPVAYDAIYCGAVHVLCGEKMGTVDAKVDAANTKIDRLDNRIYALLLIAIGQLITVITGVVGIWMVNHAHAVASAATVSKLVTP